MEDGGQGEKGSYDGEAPMCDFGPLIWNYDLLTRDGYHVAVVQNPTLSLKGDAAAARLVIDAQDGPVVLVGHSYGGAVITEAGTDPNVAALVYIAAFAPDKDESVNTLLG